MLEFLYYNYMSGDSDFCFCNKHTEKITSRDFGMLNNNSNNNNNKL